MFIELTQRNWNRDSKEYEIGSKFLLDINTDWEICDMGDGPAHWQNMKLGQNKMVNETYIEIKEKLIRAGLLIEE